jgi:hypothetical protein
MKNKIFFKLAITNDCMYYPLLTYENSYRYEYLESFIQSILCEDQNKFTKTKIERYIDLILINPRIENLINVFPDQCKNIKWAKEFVTTFEFHHGY